MNNGKITSNVSHSELIVFARIWLQNKCSVIATECGSVGSEIPDAIGWMSNAKCIVIECKVSRSDFLAEDKKCHVRSGISMGDYRYFLVPKGMISKEEVPDGYGLICYSAECSRFNRCRLKVQAPKRTKPESASHLEKKMLISMAKRTLMAFDIVKPFSHGE